MDTLKKLLLSFVIFSMLVLFPGCTGKTEDKEASVPAASSAQSDSTASKDEETTQLETKSDADKQTKTPDFSLDESDCSQWQLAYLDFLREVMEREAPVRAAHSAGRFEEDDIQLSDSYCLYDVDKDEIPELFIRFGSAEADYRTEVYTYRNKSAVLIGDYPSGHSCLYTWPKENAVLYVWGHMGYAEMDKLSIVNGNLEFNEIFTENLSESPEADYTAEDKIVPGAVYLPMFRTTLNLPQGAVLTLPVYDYNKTIVPIGNQSVKFEKDKEAIMEVLTGSKKLYGVSADGFGGDTGWIFLDDYCQPGGVDQFSDQKLKIRKTGWLDFNQDGRKECVLSLGETAERNDISDKYIILSVQDDIVYAYCINYYGNFEIFQDGVFAGEDDLSFGVSFYKNQCYIYTKPHDANKRMITWNEEPI